MKINCPNCKKDIELSITNILRQRIQNKIEELEIGNNYCYECGIDYQEYAAVILLDLLK